MKTVLITGTTKESEKPLAEKFAQMRDTDLIPAEE